MAELIPNHTGRQKQLEKTDFGSVVMGLPGGETCVQAPRGVIDFNHLSQQTAHDKQLEHELLKLFSKQAFSVLWQLPLVTTQEKRALAHRIRGAALAIGANRVAESAAKIEQNPELSHEMDVLLNELILVKNMIAAIYR